MIGRLMGKTHLAGQDVPGLAGPELTALNLEFGFGCQV